MPKWTDLSPVARAVIVGAAACAVIVVIGQLPDSSNGARVEVVKRGPPPTGYSAPSPSAPPGALEASAGCSADRVWVENRSAQVWEQTRVVVNRSWEYGPGAVVPGRQPYMPGLFTDSDGTRLSLLAVACQSIDIHATVGGRRMHWNGARE